MSAPANSLPEYLSKLLVRIADQQGFSDYSIVPEIGARNGVDGFMGVMQRVSIVGTRHNQTSVELPLICKVPPSEQIRRQMSAAAFAQEVYAYKRILPQFIEFQRAKGLGAADGFYAYPKCYGTYANPPTSEYAIVLEDLRPQGLRMWNKLENIDYAHARLVLAEMGKLHAMSFALRAQQPAILAEYARIESGMAKQATHPMAKQFYDAGFDRAIALLQSDKDAALRAKMLRLKEQYPRILAQTTTGALAEPFAALNHGDFWNNNAMFRYASAESRLVTGVCLIDWQMGQYSSPATDVAYYLYSSTDQTLRENLYDELLRVYYSNFEEHLRRLGGDPATQFTFADLQEQLRQFAIYGLIFGTLLAQVMTVKPEEIPDMDNMGDRNTDDFLRGNSSDGSESPEYTKRMGDIMRDFDARGFFASKFFDA